MLLNRRAIVPIAAALVLALGAVMFVFVGRDFYPAIDGGMIQLHLRAPPGTRIETTEQIFQQVEDKIRQVIPKKDLDLIVDNFGLPAVSYNWAFADGTTIAVNDGVIMVSLKAGHAPTADYVRKLREVLPAAFPEDLFYFQPADIATQILNFGLTAQIDVRTVGYDRANNLHCRGTAAPYRRHSGDCRRPYTTGSVRPRPLCADRSRPSSAVRHYAE
jgi:multidrug efflux pump subunit AcrB